VEVLTAVDVCVSTIVVTEVVTGVGAVTVETGSVKVNVMVTVSVADRQR
jgi:hypothetical protein